MAKIFWDLFWIALAVYFLWHPSTILPDFFRIMNVCLAVLWTLNLKNDLALLPSKKTKVNE